MLASQHTFRKGIYNCPGLTHVYQCSTYLTKNSTLRKLYKQLGDTFKQYFASGYKNKTSLANIKLFAQLIIDKNKLDRNSAIAQFCIICLHNVRLSKRPNQTIWLLVYPDDTINCSMWESMTIEELMEGDQNISTSPVAKVNVNGTKYYIKTRHIGTSGTPPHTAPNDVFRRNRRIKVLPVPTIFTLMDKGIVTDHRVIPKLSSKPCVFDRDGRYSTRDECWIEYKGKRYVDSMEGFNRALLYGHTVHTFHKHPSTISAINTLISRGFLLEKRLRELADVDNHYRWAFKYRLDTKLSFHKAKKKAGK